MYRPSSSTFCTRLTPIVPAMGEEPFERLRRARKEAGFKGPAEAAARFHWSKDTYKSHENGIRGITPTAARRYGKAFRVSAAWLLTGEGQQAEMPSPDEITLLM